MMNAYLSPVKVSRMCPAGQDVTCVLSGLDHNRIIQHAGEELVSVIPRFQAREDSVRTGDDSCLGYSSSRSNNQCHDGETHCRWDNESIEDCTTNDWIFTRKKAVKDKTCLL